MSKGEWANTQIRKGNPFSLNSFVDGSAGPNLKSLICLIKGAWTALRARNLSGYFHVQLCAWWHFTAPFSGSRAELRYNFSVWKYLHPEWSHCHPPLTRAPGSSAPLAYATYWGRWEWAKHGSCGAQVCQACDASASSTRVPLPCAEHSESERPGAKTVSEVMAWEPPNKLLSSAIPLHDIQTYCLNKALCCSLKRGEEDKVYILIIWKCYLALLFQVPQQHRCLSGKCL